MKLNITDGVLDAIGFTDYWDEHCTWGTRRLVFKDLNVFEIIENCEQTCCDNGYDEGYYISNHWLFLDDNYETHELYFLHQMYNIIKKYYPDNIDEFIEKCEKVRMRIYLKNIIK